MLVFNRKELTALVPSGYKVTFTELVAKHQRLLTEAKIPVDQRFSSMLLDIIKDIEGTEWETLTQNQRKNLLASMPEGDRMKVLCDARQLAKSHSPVYHYNYKYKDKDGANKNYPIEFALLDKDNIGTTIKNIEAMFDKEQLTPALKQRISEVNTIGGFPCKPSLNEFKSLQLLADNPHIVLDGATSPDGVLKDLELDFKLLTEKLEKSAKNIADSSHKSILIRQMRYKKKNDTSWKKLTTTELDQFPLDAADWLRNQILLHEPNVDANETFTSPKDHEKGEHDVQINLLMDINFFFPSMK